MPSTLGIAYGRVADTSNQETLQNRTNEQNGGRMDGARVVYVRHMDNFV